MTVKTKFHQDDFISILSKYDLGEYRKSTPFVDGTVQTNLLMQTTKGRYAFRYYESRSKENALFETELLHYLHECNYLSPAPIQNRDNEFVGEYKGKPYALFEFLDGVHMVNPNDTDYTPQHNEVAQALAKLHVLTENYKPSYYETRESRDPESCFSTAKCNAVKISDENLRVTRLKWIERELDQIELPLSLPRGICHADSNYTNFLFREEKITGVLDFDDACYACILNDLANLIYFWAWPPEKELNFPFANHLIEAYENVRPLSHDEKTHLYDALKMVIMMTFAWFIDDDQDFASEKKRIEYLNAIGREGFYKELFGKKT